MPGDHRDGTYRHTLAAQKRGITMSAVTDFSCGKIYPQSIEQGLQKGDIYTVSGHKLYHHLCGFAFCFGESEDAVCKEIYSRFLSPDAVTDRRFVLFVSDRKAKDFFGAKEDLNISCRYFFEYQHKEPPEIRELPQGMRFCEIGRELFNKLPGRITPLFSWDNADDFVKNGKGICIMKGDEPAAWAFSAAVSDKELDIGIETAESCRGQGLATIVGAAMIRYALGCGKTPVWACHSENAGSVRTAEKLGFVRTAECVTVSRR